MTTAKELRIEEHKKFIKFLNLFKVSDFTRSGKLHDHLGKEVDYSHSQKTKKIFGKRVGMKHTLRWPDAEGIPQRIIVHVGNDGLIRKIDYLVAPTRMERVMDRLPLMRHSGQKPPDKKIPDHLRHPGERPPTRNDHLRHPGEKPPSRKMPGHSGHHGPKR